VVVGTANATATSSGFSDNPIVATDNGLVRGTRVDDVRQFRGIPYAASPAAENRWKPPQPAASWRGVRDATTFGQHCAQSPSPFGPGGGGEDCLFLNVYLPKPAVPGLGIAPVMVWIHGGALSVGASDDYNPPRWWPTASSS
jgi:para-nitrobenzyl esterase